MPSSGSLETGSRNMVVNSRPGPGNPLPPARAISNDRPSAIQNSGKTRLKRRPR